MTEAANNAPGNRVIVIGGGLAGVCAAHNALQHGSSVILLDKSAFLGGNSTKASSGIAGTPTQAQISNGVLDGVELFVSDTNRSFHAIDKSTQLVDPKQYPVSPLVAEMGRLSGPSLDWLVKYFNCDLSVLGFMGGHSQPRTHRGKEKMPGMAITYALINALEKICKEEPQRAQIVNKARVTRLIRGGDVSDDGKDSTGNVTGLVYERKNKDGSTEQIIERGAVVIATGGYAADFSDESSLLARFTPQLISFSSTNGEHATGDGVKVAEQVGAGLVDMDRVQVHPTGLVDPKNPKSHTKFLCAEALRGAGGVIVNQKGERFVDELGRRDHVSNAMLKNASNGPFYLILNEKSAKEMEHHCSHYVGRGLMKVYPTMETLCKECNIPAAALRQTIQQYQKDADINKASRGASVGGQGFFASLFGSKSKDKGSKASGEATLGNKGTPDKYGKTLFRNAEVFRFDRPVHVALVTPVVHYTMGGVLVNEKTEVLDAKTGKPIGGLYCAGEAAGGVHGKNRLGGNSLLDCVVYGRVAGERASSYLLQTYLGPFSRNRRLNAIYRQLKLDELPELPPLPKAALPPPPTPSAASISAPASAPAANTPTPSGDGKLRKISRAEVAKHAKENDCWCIVHGQVLDLTKFLPDHPGGKQSILMYAGKDCTKEFDIVHQVEVIEKYTPESVIGVVSD